MSLLCLDCVTWQESNNDEDVFLIPFRNYNIRRSRRLIVNGKYEYYKINYFAIDKLSQS